MDTLNNAQFIKEFGKLCDRMDENRWHEKNSGNISYILAEEEVNLIPKTNKSYTINLNVKVESLKGKYILCTASGKHIKNVSSDPFNNSGIVKIANCGTKCEVVWGFNDGGRPTSEFSTHLLTHQTRLKIDPKHRLVVHAHTTNIMAMTFVHELDDCSFTRSLWKKCTEAIVVFPEGVGVLPWMLCGNSEIGYATAEKMKTKRIVVWALHGIFAAGESFDDCLGLIETVDKAAQIYMMTLGHKNLNTIEDSQLKELAEAFKIDYRKDYLKK